MAFGLPTYFEEVMGFKIEGVSCVLTTSSDIYVRVFTVTKLSFYMSYKQPISSLYSTRAISVKMESLSGGKGTKSLIYFQERQKFDYYCNQ